MCSPYVTVLTAPESRTGFRKRKLERKEKAKQKLVKKFKEEKQRIKQEQRDKKSQYYFQSNAVPEVEHLIERVDVHETDTHVVTITTMDMNQVAGQLGCAMGSNTKQAVEAAQVEKTSSDDKVKCKQTHSKSIKRQKK